SGWGGGFTVRARAPNSQRARPFATPPAAAGNLTAVPVDQHEIVGSLHLAEPNAVALHPEAAPTALAHREVAERHVAVAFHLENPAGARSLGEALASLCIYIGRHSKPLLDSAAH